MRTNKSKYFIYIILLIVVIAGNILIGITSQHSSQCFNIFVLIVGIILDILAMGYFIVSDIINNRKTIAHYGSLSLFETVDRRGTSKQIIEKLFDKKSEHLMYVDCSGFSRNEMENIKQRLYDDLTNYSELYKHNKDILPKHSIDNVYIPASLNVQVFNENVFYNRTRVERYTIYIFDNYSANSFFIKQIGDRLNNRAKQNSEHICQNTYIIFLDNAFIYKNEYSSYPLVRPKITSNDINNMISEHFESDEETSKVKVSNSFNCENINSVLTIENIIKDPFYVELLKIDPELIAVLYFNVVGDYKNALVELNKKFICKLDQIDTTDNLKRFAVLYLYADTLHLLNFYYPALNICNYLLTEKRIGLKESDSLCNETLKLEAHILKHLGLFSSDGKPSEMTDSNSVLNRLQITDNNYNTNTFVEKKIFINDYFRFLYNKISPSLDEEINKSSSVLEKDFAKFTKRFCEIFTSGDASDRMYYAAFLAYEKPSMSLKIIDDVIDYYELLDHRQKYNAYYVKAEVLRVLNRYEEAYDYYIKSSGVTDNHDDINLLDQNYFSLKALEKLNLVKGVASYQIKAYRNKKFTKEGLRSDYKNSIQSISKNLKEIQIRNETVPRLLFNIALVNYIDREDLEDEELIKLLNETIFIIL